MSKIVTFGEIMLRLTTPDFQTIENSNSFHVNYGGVEANVAISLKRFGHETYFVSKLPNNELGDAAIRYLNGFKVNTDYIIRGGNNIGIYYLESGFGGRNSKVLYNRKNSAITKINQKEIDYDLIFKDADWFHFSGITLALSNEVRNTLYEMLEYAKKYQVKVSFDCNYRNTLWTIEEASPHFIKVLPYIDILFATNFDLEKLFKIKRGNNMSDYDHFKKFLNHSQVEMVLGTKRIVHSQNDNEMSAYAITKDQRYESSKIRFNIHDRIGAGDAFAAGIINGLLENSKDILSVLEFGLSASVLKHTLWGDAFTLTKEDLLSFMKNNRGNINR